MESEIAAGLYHGAVVKVAQGGEVVFDTVVGTADGARTLPPFRVAHTKSCSCSLLGVSPSCRGEQRHAPGVLKKDACS